MVRKWLLEIDKRSFRMAQFGIKQGVFGRKINKKEKFFKFFFYFVVLFGGMVYICRENYKPK